MYLSFYLFVVFLLRLVGSSSKKTYIHCALKHQRIVRFLLPQEYKLTWKRNTIDNKIPCSGLSLKHCVSDYQANAAITVKFGTQSFC